MVQKKSSKTSVAKKRPASKTSKKTKTQHWFAPKRYGWGWGKPLTWQGWAVYTGFFGSLATYLVWVSNQVSADQLGEDSGYYVVAGFVIWAAVALPTLFFICLATSEAPRWRWGNKKK